MMKNRVIVCDKCKAEFQLDNSSIISESLNSKRIGLKRRYFKCPKCQEQYTIDVTDIQLRNMIKQYKLLAKKQHNLMRKQAGEIRLQNNQIKLDELRKQILDYESVLSKEVMGNEGV